MIVASIQMTTFPSYIKPIDSLDNFISKKNFHLSTIAISITIIQFKNHKLSLG